MHKFDVMPKHWENVEVIFVRDYESFKVGDTVIAYGICPGCKKMIIKDYEDHVPLDVIDEYKPNKCQYKPLDYEKQHKIFLRKLTKLLAFGTTEGVLYADELQKLIIDDIIEIGGRDEFMSGLQEHNKY